MTDLEEEMVRRTENDGIPRCIVNGKIMKQDWQAPEWLDQEKIEEHLVNLFGGKSND